MERTLHKSRQRRLWKSQGKKIHYKLR